jgi:hypothetical protein
MKFPIEPPTKSKDTTEILRFPRVIRDSPLNGGCDLVVAVVLTASIHLGLQNVLAALVHVAAPCPGLVVVCRMSLSKFVHGRPIRILSRGAFFSTITSCLSLLAGKSTDISNFRRGLGCPGTV